MRIIPIIVASAIAGCVSVCSSEGSLRPGELVYLFGPLSAVEEQAPRESCSSDGEARFCTVPIGVALSWFGEVEVVAVRGNRVKFKRSVAYHPPNIAWVPRSAVIHPAEFVQVTSWETPGSYSFCDDSSECWELAIAANGTFQLSMNSSSRGVCEFWPNEAWQPCRIHGDVKRARGFLELEGNEGHILFLADHTAGPFCWIGMGSETFACKAHNYVFQAERACHFLLKQTSAIARPLNATLVCE